MNIGRTKAESYTAQRWDDGTLLGDHRLLTYVTCLEMIEVDKIVCCDAEFALCNTLMRSKHKLPGLLYSALRPAITKVTNVDNTIFFKFAEIKSYRNEQKDRMLNTLKNVVLLLCRKRLYLYTGFSYRAY